MKLGNSAGLPVPKEVLRQHTVVLGKTRSGKSSTMRVLVEWLLDNRKPVCIIDPKGDWWGLKSSASGKRAGYGLVIFGGAHADVPINEHSGAEVAKLMATGNRPCIIDLRGWMPGERTRFFIDFAATLFKFNKGPHWLVIDECHNFAPQGKVQDPMAGKMLHWANRLASEGSGLGITLLSASQRPQKVHKDYVTSHETLIAKRAVHKLDRDAIKDWIDACGDPEQGQEVLRTLAGITRAQGWVYSPEIAFGPELVTFPMFKTYDSFKAPSGGRDRKLSGWATVNLDVVRKSMAQAVADIKANDPAALKAEVAALKRQLAAASMVKPATSDKIHQAAVSAAHAAGHREATLRLVTEFDGMLTNLGKSAAEQVAGRRKALQRHLTAANLRVAAPKPVGFSSVPPLAAPKPRPVAAPATPSGVVPPMALKIVNEIHRASPMALSFEAAALRAGVSRRSSAYSKYRREVEASPEVMRRGDGRLHSAEGYAKPVEPGRDPVEAFAARLPGSYGAMLRVIAAGGGLTRDAVAAGAGVSPTSSGLSAGLRELQTLGLVQLNGDLYVLNPEL